MKLRSILVLVVLLAACSGDDSSGGTSSEAPTATEAPTTSGATTTTGAPPVTEATTTTGAPATTEISTDDDLSGPWEGELTQLSATGPCPSMPTQRGTVLFEQTGATFIMVFQEGGRWRLGAAPSEVIDRMRAAASQPAADPAAEAFAQ